MSAPAAAPVPADSEASKRKSLPNADKVAAKTARAGVPPDYVVVGLRFRPRTPGSFLYVEHSYIEGTLGREWRDPAKLEATTTVHDLASGGQGAVDKVKKKLKPDLFGTGGCNGWPLDLPIRVAEDEDEREENDWSYPRKLTHQLRLRVARVEWLPGFAADREPNRGGARIHQRGHQSFLRGHALQVDQEGDRRRASVLGLQRAAAHGHQDFRTWLGKC